MTEVEPPLLAVLVHRVLNSLDHPLDQLSNFSINPRTAPRLGYRRDSSSTPLNTPPRTKADPTA
jgi:hypothetical protein